MVSLDIAVMCWTGRGDRRTDLMAIQRRIPQRLSVIDCSSETTLWQSARKAWLTVYAGKGTHGLVLQEDMLPSKGFLPAALEALETKPDEVVCFFTSRRTSLVKPAIAMGKSWAVAPDATWGGSVAMPKALIEDFIRWERAKVSADYRHDDGRIAMWAIETNRLIWVTVPSLLEHVGAARSTQGYGGGINRNRVAAWWVEDATGIDWSKGADDPVRGKADLGAATSLELSRIRDREMLTFGRDF